MYSFQITDEGIFTFCDDSNWSTPTVKTEQRKPKLKHIGVKGNCRPETYIFCAINGGKSTKL